MTSADQPIPITINGNTLEASNENVPSTVFSADAADSNHITLQTYAHLTVDQKQELHDQKVELLEYVSDLTYLCRYEPIELRHIKEKSYIRHVAEYDRRLKTDKSLKDSLGPTVGEDQARTSISLNVELHDHPDLSPDQVKSELAQRTGVSESDIDLDGNSLAITIDPQYLHRIEALDGVKSIHEEAPTTLCNNLARQVVRMGGSSGHSITGKPK